MRWWREIFFFSKTEWTGIAVLGFFFGLIIVWRSSDSFPSQTTAWKTSLDSFRPYSRPEQETKSNFKELKRPYFKFDPNLLSVDSFCLLGFSPKQAISIQNYRNTGANFDTPEDFSRLYVVSSAHFQKLRPFIRITTTPHYTSKSLLFSQVNVIDSAKEVKLRKRDSLKLNYQLFHCELNSADSLGLLILPGIGPYTAHKILKYRKRLGGFFSTSQLLEIGVEQEVLAVFSHKCTVDRSKIHKMRLDSIHWPQLKQHPYIGTYLARGFLLYLRYNPYPKAWSELIDNQMISVDLAEKLKYYIDIP